MFLNLPRAAFDWSSLQQPPDPPAYIPHSAPETSTATKDAKMSKTSLLKTLFVPALISLVLYLVLYFALIPFWRRYRNRYSQYLPLDAISNRTQSLRQRAFDAAARFLLPASWRTDFGAGRFRMSAQDGSGSDSDDDEGEELFDVNENRREALSLDSSRRRQDEARRLSRELEEGFRDDSDEESDDNRLSRSTSRTR